MGFLKYIVNSCKFTRSFGRVELECRMIFYSPGLLYHFIIVFGGRKRRQSYFLCELNTPLATGR